MKNFFSLWLLVFWAFIPAAQGKTSTLGAASLAGEYLEIPNGARPVALGSAFAAAAADINALHWNPAGLIGIEKHRFMGCHTSWIAGIYSENLSYAQPVEELGNLGANVTYLNFGGIDRWGMDGAGNPLPLQTQYTPMAFSGTLAWALPVSRVLAAGFGIKVAHEQIDQQGSDAAALDAGIHWDLDQVWACGAVVRNIGITSNSELLPLNLRLGGKWNFPYSFSENDCFDLFADFEFRWSDQPWAGFGVEYSWSKLVQLRLGWNDDFSQEISKSVFSGGAGVHWDAWEIDYAMAPVAEFGFTHQISLEFSF